MLVRREFGEAERAGSVPCLVGLVWLGFGGAPYAAEGGGAGVPSGRCRTMFPNRRRLR